MTRTHGQTNPDRDIRTLERVAAVLLLAAVAVAMLTGCNPAAKASVAHSGEAVKVAGR
jgi:hypothetical protein